MISGFSDLEAAGSSCSRYVGRQSTMVEAYGGTKISTHSRQADKLGHTSKDQLHVTKPYLISYRS